MDVFKAKSYRAVIEGKLKAGGKKRPRGIIQKLAKSLKCHPTLVSQILHEKADLSIDQGILFCEFANFGQDETDHFLDMLLSERAGLPVSKRHFQQKMNRRVASRESFEYRVKAGGNIPEEHRQQYYETWLPQAAHIFCSIYEQRTPLSRYLPRSSFVPARQKVLATRTSLKQSPLSFYSKQKKDGEN